MSKKHFIALADAIREHNRRHIRINQFTEEHIETLAQFCRSQNYNFKDGRWRDYIAGECGPSGGSVKPKPKVKRVKPVEHKHTHTWNDTNNLIEA